MTDSNSLVDEIKWNDQGLVAAIAQEARTGAVLMMAWMNPESLQLTLSEKRAVYWSRSRQKIWRKGEESGHIQWLKDIRLDCDGDCLLLQVEQIGGIACHTGKRTCFFRSPSKEAGWVEGEPYDNSSTILEAIDQVLAARKNADPESSYVASLYRDGLNKILEKVGEEATETILAAKDHETNQNTHDLLHETADLWFHTMVMLRFLNMTSADVLLELGRRFGLSGIEEKQLRKKTPQE